MNINKDDYVKVIRFSNYGFNVKPYNSSRDEYRELAYSHAYPFIYARVEDVDTENYILPPNVPIVEPPMDDTKWNGCFAFLEIYDPVGIQNDSSKIFYEKENIAYLRKSQLVWVRNCNYKGEPFIKYSPPALTERDIRDWVVMPIEKVLERTQKATEYFGKTPGEVLTEVYLTETQVKNLYFEPVQPEPPTLLKQLSKNFQELFC